MTKENFLEMMTRHMFVLKSCLLTLSRRETLQSCPDYLDKDKKAWASFCFISIITLHVTYRLKSN